MNWAPPPKPAEEIVKTKINVKDRTAAIRLNLANGDTIVLDAIVAGVYRLFTKDGQPLFNADRSPAYNLDVKITVKSEAK